VNPALYGKEMQAYNAMHTGSEINESVISGWKNIVKSLFPDSASSLRKYYQQYNQLKNPLFDKDFYQAHFKDSFHRNYEFESLNQSLYSSTMKQGLQELLRYADRNSMAHSREVRLPFLNHDLVDFLFTLPSHFKIKDGWTKWIMRASTSSILPETICWRKDKIGYEPPQKNWMENPILKEKIMQGKTDLVNKRILSKGQLNKQVVAEDANVSLSNSWRILMADNL
jgi:asparagine synthase (glutamine-hydrolysing)